MTQTRQHRRARSAVVDPALSFLLSHPEVVEAEIARRSLSRFIRAFWRQIDPSEYVHGWHIDAICEHLEAVSRGEIRRLLINVPPRHMKSIAVAVAWPAWTWAQASESGVHCGPRTRFLFSSYALSLSVRDSVKCRRLIESPRYQGWFGDGWRLVGDQNTKMRFDNTAGGYRLATSVGGANTGEGGDVIVVDDPHNVKDGESPAQREAALTWWNEVMSTRLNDPKAGAFVVIMQRVHERDLAGEILAQGGYEHLMLPAEYEPERRCRTSLGFEDHRERDGEPLWSERFGEREIEAMKRALGSYGAASQLQQRPAPREGGIFRPAWFPIVTRKPDRAKRVRFWDRAATAAVGGNDPDWTVGVRMARTPDGQYVIEDVRRMRGTPLQTERLMRATAEADGPEVAIWTEQEPGASGKAILDHLRRNVLEGFAFRGVPSRQSKESRWQALSTHAEGGAVAMLAGAWNRDFLDEISLVPNAAHDDQADAAAGAFLALAKGPASERDVLSGAGVL